MSYDVYVELGGETREDVDILVRDEHHHRYKIPSIAARIRLLAGVAARNESIRDYAVSGGRRRGDGYRSLVHDRANPQNTPYASQLIGPALSDIEKMGLKASAPDFRLLPPGSWFLQFTFTLAKPWISKDDDPFYVAESVNPVRKDKVFKVPTMSAAGWKGLLRWTATHVRLTLKRDRLSDEEFAQERLRLALLFGDEKGEEPGATKDFAAFLDGLKPTARGRYEQLLRAHYSVGDDQPLPHHSGRLMFYPTFFNLIDVEVINPHSRRTKAGTHPIYLECVPAKAEGTFSLLYVPFDLIGQDEAEIRRQAADDLQRVAEGLQAMFLIYGFSAKRTSGYGTAKDEIQGHVRTRSDEKSLTRLSQLAQEVKDVAF